MRTVTDFCMPVLLRLADEGRLSGALTLAPAGGAGRSVLLDEGAVVFATGGAADKRLGDRLLERGLVTAGDLDAAIARARSTGELLGKAIAALGAAPEGVVEGCARRLVVERVAELFPLERCSVAFEAKTHVERRPFVEVRAADVMVAGMRRVGDPVRVERWLGGTDVALSPASDPLAALSTEALTPEEAFLLTRLDGPVTPREVADFGLLPRREALALVCALRFAGVLVPAAAGEGARWAGDSATLEDFGIRPQTGPAVPGFDTAEAARVFYLIEEKLRGVNDGADHYALLEVERRSPADRIKASYRELAKAYHPDRHHQLAAFDADIKNHLSTIFDALTKAYQVLSNPDEREAYDRRLAALAHRDARPAPVITPPPPAGPRPRPARSPAPPPAPPRAEEPAALDAAQWYAKGEAFSAAGDHVQAARAYRCGLAVAPDDVPMQTALARSLGAMGGQYRKQAVDAYKRAIELDPASTGALRELAALYKGAGRVESARALYRKVLIIDRDDPDALAALGPDERPRKRFLGINLWEKKK